MAVTAVKQVTPIPDERLNPAEYVEVVFGPFSDDSNAAGMAAILLTGAHDVLPLPFSTRERLVLTEAWAQSTTVSSVTDSTTAVAIIRKSNTQAVPTGAQLTSLNDNRIMSGGCVGLQTTGTPGSGGIAAKADGTTAIPIILASTSGWTQLEVDGHANVIEPGDSLFVYSQAAPTALEGLFFLLRFRKVKANKS